jgi:hypothetical protein
MLIITRLTPFLAVFLLSISLSAATPRRTGALPCLVVDKSRGTPLDSGTVCIRELGRCRTSDAAGTIVFSDCPPGVYELVAAADSHDTLVLPNVIINTGHNTLLRIELPRSAAIQDLDRMAVTAKRIETKKADQVTSVTRFSTFELENTAGTNNDVNRVLHTLPSVLSGDDDLDNTMFVRGGNSRENVFIVDGIELDNISHFSGDMSSSGGALGFIDGALLQQLDFYAGGFPASLPPRISAVADMAMRNGSTTNRAYTINLASSGLGLVAEGPFPKQKGSYLIAARYVDIRSIKNLVNLTGLPRFGDSQSRFNLTLNEHNTLTLSTILSYDNQTDLNGYNTGSYSIGNDYELFNAASGLQWNTIHDRWKNRLMVSGVIRSESGFDRVTNWKGPFDIYNEWYHNWEPVDDSVPITGDDYLVHYYSRINERTVTSRQDKQRTLQCKDDFTWYLRENDQFSIGIYGSQRKLHLRDLNNQDTRQTVYWLPDSTNPFNLHDTTYVDTPYTIDSLFYDTAVGGYANYVLAVGPFKTVAGIRADYFRLLRDYGVSPRFSFSYDNPTAGAFGISGGLYYQQPARLSEYIRSIVLANPNYPMPLPAMEQIELSRCWQGVLSYEKQFATSHVLIAESYYKWYDREYPLHDPDTYEFEEAFYKAVREDRPWRLALPDGRKKAYGFELSFQKKRQRGFYYGFSYSWMSVRNEYADGHWYDDANDVRNHGNLTLGFEFLKHHCIAARMAFSEGRPYSAGSKLDEGGMVYDTTKGYFTERLDQPVVSVNLRYNFRLFPRFGTITGYIELWNVLNYTPVLERHLGWYGYTDYRGNGIIPVAGLMVDF